MQHERIIPGTRYLASKHERKQEKVGECFWSSVSGDPKCKWESLVEWEGKGVTYGVRFYFYCFIINLFRVGV